MRPAAVGRCWPLIASFLPTHAEITVTPLLLGELAALAASVCFTFGPTLFTLAGREVGSLTTNRLRLLLGALYFGIIHWLVYGTPFPHARPDAIAYMLVSGIIGLALSDAFLFEAFVLIGPRIALLVLNLSPALATALAWVWLGERLSLSQIAAIAVVLGGVSWVVLERQSPDEEGHRQRQHNPRGLTFALVAAFISALSILLSKMGLNTGLPTLSGATIRMFGGMLALWTWTVLAGKALPTFAAFREHPKALRTVAVAVLIGPVLGMSLGLFAIKTIPVGIATTLSALAPILLLPVGHWFFHERITSRAILGTLIATAGVIWLLL